MDEFDFFNSRPLFSATVPNHNNNDYLLNSAGMPITHRGVPIRQNDHIIIETDKGFLIRSEGETIHLDKVAKDEWPISDELIKEDVSWWTKFKEKFK